MSPPGTLQRLDRFLAAHRERGLPITTQRRAVRGDLPQISRMTVHRILGTFVCLDCGDILDLEDARLNRLRGPMSAARASRSTATTFTFEAGAPAADKSSRRLGPDVSALPVSESRGKKLNLD
jgi:hypothetical protein